MKNALAILLATSFMATQVSAQTLSAPVAPIIATDSSCDDPATSAVEECPAALLPASSGLGGATGVALIGTAAIVGLIAVVANDSSTSTTTTPRP